MSIFTKPPKPTNLRGRRQPYRQPPTVLAYVAVPLGLASIIAILGWLVLG